MKYVWMAVIGLVVGIIARYIYPGAVEMSLITSALLGIAGSFLAGIVGGLIHKPADGQVHPAGFVYSIVGALVLIFLLRNILHVV